MIHDLRENGTWNTMFKNWCPTPILPMAYDESISYMEQIIQLYTRVNQIIAYLEAYEDEVLNKSKEYTDAVVSSNITALRTELYDKITEETNAKVKALNDMLTAMINSNKEDAERRLEYLESATSILQGRLDDYYEYVNMIQDNLLEKIDATKGELKDYVNSLVIDVTNVYVKSPFSSEIITIQQALDEIVYNLSIGALTAEEFDQYTPSCYKYDRQGITALEFQTILRFIWFAQIYLQMRNPFTGRYSEIDVIIYALADLHKNALTAVEYDALELSAIVFTGSDITAYQYDWNGKSILVKKKATI